MIWTKLRPRPERGVKVRIAFVSIPRFPCAVEAWRSPTLAGKPLIVGDADQPKQVLACSQAAYASGVRPGMAIRKALGLCPQAAVLPPDLVLYQSRWETILDALDDISPEVEDEAPGRAYLNASGLQSIHQDEAALCRYIGGAVEAASGLRAGVGLAGNKLTAFAAAAQTSPGEFRIVHDGEEAEFLAPREISLLSVSPEIVARLEMLGFQTIGEVAALTATELQTQFGRQGERLWRLANGIDEERLYPRRRKETVEAGLSFEAPVAGVDVLIAAARQLLSRLRLPLRGRAARELTLQAELVSGRGWERRLVFREAVSENERLLFLLRSTFMNSPPPQAVRTLSLRMSGLAGETGKQLSLGERGRVQRQLEETIRQLRARYGHSPIYYCVDVEPWSVIPEDRQILVESDA